MSTRTALAALMTATVVGSALLATASSASAVEAENVTDGGFEATHPGSDSHVPDENVAWTDSDSDFGGVVCTTTSAWCWSDEAADLGFGPRTGTGWAWFGYNDSQDHTSSLEQRVFVPAGATTLSYYTRNTTVSAPSNATLTAQVDGQAVNVQVEPEQPESAYHLNEADISAFADGGWHVLRFAYDGGDQAAGGGWGFDANNLELDDVAIS